mmetsp:Transcript_21500/g.43864  ORF Transcript_21500/g.43864 Transcript_21500/m.43864 type:complete len:223 (-) Transcript_21500:2-670(-)
MYAAAASLSRWGGTRQRIRKRTMRSPNDRLSSPPAGLATPSDPIKMNFVAFFDSSTLSSSPLRFFSIASHKRRAASETRRRGWPYIPLNVMLCPKHETTASQSFVAFCNSSSDKSKIEASVTSRLLAKSSLDLGTISSSELRRRSFERAMARTFCFCWRSWRTTCLPVAPVAPTTRVVVAVEADADMRMENGAVDENILRRIIILMSIERKEKRPHVEETFF